MPTRILYLYFFLLQIFLGQYCYGQRNSNDPLFNNFRNEILAEQEERYGRVMNDIETREAYYLLLTTHSIEDLVKYTDDSIPAVRAEIFMGLVMKNADETILKKILNKHLNDTAEYTTKSADVAITESVIGSMQFGIWYKAEHKVVDVDLNERLERVRRYSDGVVIPGVRHGAISKDSLLKLDSLACTLDGIKIIEFTLILISTKQTEITSKNILTERMKSEIREMKRGDQVIFTEIKAQGPDNRVRQMPSIVLKIK